MNDSMKRSSIVFFVILAMALSACGSAGNVQRPADEDQVNIGYGSVDKDELTYAVSSVRTSNDMETYSNMYDYLRGRVPGLEVGPENSMSSVHIRGVKSINSSTAPLVLLDGTEVPDLDAVSPYDVYSVSVLKDASSSIYGVRGANGVILITTKGAHQQSEAAAAAKKKEREERRAARKKK